MENEQILSKQIFDVLSTEMRQTHDVDYLSVLSLISCVIPSEVLTIIFRILIYALVLI